MVCENLKRKGILQSGLAASASAISETSVPGMVASFARNKVSAKINEHVRCATKLDRLPKN